jgi:hypothetical protein
LCEDGDKRLDRLHANLERIRNMLEH